jgi:hypothetical protein
MLERKTDRDKNGPRDSKKNVQTQRQIDRQTNRFEIGWRAILK